MNTITPQNSVVAIPRNWSSCIITFPSSTNPRTVHTAMCGIGNHVTRNKAENSFVIIRNPELSQSFFKKAVEAAQLFHGATVELLLEPLPEPQKESTQSLLSITREIVGRIKASMNRN